VVAPDGIETVLVVPPDPVPGAFVGVRMTDRTPTDFRPEPLLAVSPPGPVGAGR
jgi:hypothetical protein